MKLLEVDRTLLEKDPTLLEVDRTLLEEDRTLLEDNSDEVTGRGSYVRKNRSCGRFCCAHFVRHCCCYCCCGVVINTKYKKWCSYFD